MWDIEMCCYTQCSVVGFVFSFEHWSHYCISKVFCEHFRPSEDVIRILLSCFLNCLFFFPIQWTQLQWSFIMYVQLSIQHKSFLKKDGIRNMWGGGVWERLATHDHLFMFLHSGCYLHRRPSSAKICSFPQDT